MHANAGDEARRWAKARTGLRSALTAGHSAALRAGGVTSTNIWKGTFSGRPLPNRWIPPCPQHLGDAAPASRGPVGDEDAQIMRRRRVPAPAKHQLRTITREHRKRGERLLVGDALQPRAVHVHDVEREATPGGVVQVALATPLNAGIKSRAYTRTKSFSRTGFLIDAMSDISELLGENVTLLKHAFDK
jgi:hypothetical protein